MREIMSLMINEMMYGRGLKLARSSPKTAMVWETKLDRRGEEGWADS
jgi:hypothetical protein